jgi:hypothetical protein
MMKFVAPMALVALVIAPPLSADQIWQKPAVKQCNLAPGAQCNVEVTCPSSHPRALSGGGGMPKAMPESNQVAMTMNLPIAENKWRVRWKNMSNTDAANVKVAVKVLCGSE